MSKENIKVPNKFFSLGKDKKGSLSILENTVRKVASRFNQYGFIDPTEEGFLKENSGKDIILELSNKTKKTGKLNSIDKYRISIIPEGSDKVHYYYKHAVICYYVA